MTKHYPAWICSDCGNKYGRRKCGTATWHEDDCCVCGERGLVTEPRDYGHLKDGWQKEKRKKPDARAAINDLLEAISRSGDPAGILDTHEAGIVFQLLEDLKR